MDTYASKLSYVLIGISLLLLSSVPAMAGMLNVPGDFPGQFRMNLLNWELYVEDVNGNPVGNSTLDMVDNYIDFRASPFDNPSGNPKYGTSQLTASETDFLLGSGTFFALPTSFYMNGSGTGTLVDNGDGTGDWTLTLPIYTVFGSNPPFSMTDVTLSTSNSQTYFDYATQTWKTADGQAMNYSTGDTVLVGKTTATDGPFVGISAIFVIRGNDPIIAATVPEPSSLLLIASGLIGLVRFRKKR
jgi:hypothetical protein